MKRFSLLGISLYLGARHTGLFGERTVRIAKKDQGRSNSLGDNWICVKRGLFIDRVIEYEEWFSGQDLKVATYGWSCGKINLKFD